MRDNGRILAITPQHSKVRPVVLLWIIPICILLADKSHFWIFSFFFELIFVFRLFFVICFEFFRHWRVGRCRMECCCKYTPSSISACVPRVCVPYLACVFFPSSFPLHSSSFPLFIHLYFIARMQHNALYAIHNTSNTTHLSHFALRREYERGFFLFSTLNREKEWGGWENKEEVGEDSGGWGCVLCCARGGGRSKRRKRGRRVKHTCSCTLFTTAHFFKNLIFWWNLQISQISPRGTVFLPFNWEQGILFIAQSPSHSHNRKMA